MRRLWRTTRRVIRDASPKRKAYLAYKEAARAKLAPLIAAEAARIGVTYNRVAIKDTKRSWGSCSAKGNLNFHYKLLFLPEHLMRYVVIHELCHRRHLHHGAAFWQEVAIWCPTFVADRQELRLLERTIGMSRGALVAYQTASLMTGGGERGNNHRAGV